jgi:hypothetical protein
VVDNSRLEAHTKPGRTKNLVDNKRPEPQEPENSNIADQHAGRHGQNCQRCDRGDDGRLRWLRPFGNWWTRTCRAPQPLRIVPHATGVTATKPGRAESVVPKVTGAESLSAESWPPVIAEQIASPGAPARSSRLFGGIAMREARGFGARTPHGPHPIGQELENSNIVDQHAGQRGRTCQRNGKGDGDGRSRFRRFRNEGTKTCRGPRSCITGPREPGARTTKPGKPRGVVYKVTEAGPRTAESWPPAIAEQIPDSGAPARFSHPFGGGAIRPAMGIGAKSPRRL